MELHKSAEYHLKKTEEELFSDLVPDEDRDMSAYSTGGIIARGREIFQDLWREINDSVCSVYRKHEKTCSNTIDLVILVATPLIGRPNLVGIDAVALAALIVKIGLPELCRGGGNAG